VIFLILLAVTVALTVVVFVGETSQFPFFFFFFFLQFFFSRADLRKLEETIVACNGEQWRKLSCTGEREDEERQQDDPVMDFYRVRLRNDTSRGLCHSSFFYFYFFFFRFLFFWLNVDLVPSGDDIQESLGETGTRSMTSLTHP